MWFFYERFENISRQTARVLKIFPKFWKENLTKGSKTSRKTQIVLNFKKSEKILIKNETVARKNLL